MHAIEGLRPNYKSKSGSQYFFSADGVYRLSDHWGRAANCRWRLQADGAGQPKTRLGFARWSDFHPDNDHEKLYFMIADHDNQTVQFYHKASEAYWPGAVLRSAPETAKRIKQVRQLFEQTAWAKYLKEGDIETIRKEIIQRLIGSDATFQQIRKEFL